MAREVAFAVVQKALEQHGWTLARIRGSHHVFTKPGALPISIPVHKRKVKAVYARKVKQICEAHEEAEEE